MEAECRLYGDLGRSALKGGAIWDLLGPLLLSPLGPIGIKITVWGRLLGLDFRSPNACTWGTFTGRGFTFWNNRKVSQGKLI